MNTIGAGQEVVMPEVQMAIGDAELVGTVSGLVESDPNASVSHDDRAVPILIAERLVREVEAIFTGQNAETAINDIVGKYLQRHALMTLEGEFAEESGPLTDEEWLWARRLAWPR